MVSREIFGSFAMRLVDNVLWFELMLGIIGMFQLEVHDKQSAGAKVKAFVQLPLFSKRDEFKFNNIESIFFVRKIKKRSQFWLPSSHPIA